MNGLFNKYHSELMNGGLDLDDAGVVLKAMLLRNTGSYSFDPDSATVAAILATGVEISVASYVRQTLGGKSVAVDDTNNRGVFDCNNIQFGTLESGQTVEAVLLYKEVNDDSDSIPLIFMDGKSDIDAAAPAAASTTGSITSVSNENPCVITSAAHGLLDGDSVYIESIGGTVEINNLAFTVANKTDNTFELSGINSTAYGAYTSGGTWKEIRRIYVDKLRYAVPSGTAVDFGGGATGTTNGAAAKKQRYIDVINLLAAVTESDSCSDADTIINLPATLGNGEFNANIGSSGLLFSQYKL